MNKEDCNKITLTYNDGTTEHFNHGYVCTVKNSEDSENLALTFNHVNISGPMLKEIYNRMCESARCTGFCKDEILRIDMELSQGRTAHWVHLEDEEWACSGCHDAVLIEHPLINGGIV